MRVWVVASLLLGAACGGTEKDGGVLTLTASPSVCAADGTSVQLQLVAKDVYGAAGSGSVTLTITHGQFGGVGDGQDGSVTLSGGKGTTLVGCLASSDAKCVGPQVVHAAWSTVDAYAVVEFTAP
jgi:hypothetical protein